jgi:phage-related protein
MRFDWAGSVACASLNGHKFWGEWFAPAPYSPTRGDGVLGPAEEFRTADSPLGHAPTPTSPLFVTPGAIGYKEAKAGEVFLKPGVGFLTKVDDKPYNYGTTYPIADTGTWTNTHTASSVTSKQVLKVQNGYGYEYEKTIQLDKNGTTLSIVHHLKNTGTKPIETFVYNHDFFQFDDQPTNSGIVVHFPWKPDFSDLQGALAKGEGNDIHFNDPAPPPPPPPPPAPGEAAPPRRRGGGGGGGSQGYLSGFSDKVSDFDITVQNTKTGVGVEETADAPLARLYFWSQSKVVCPEGYIAINVAPGKTQSWTLHFKLFAPADKKMGE